jgi:hypothetical protein
MIKLGSITNAQRAHKILSNKGYVCRLSRLQNPKPGDGCGYILKVYNAGRDKAIHILENSGINILGVEDL